MRAILAILIFLHGLIHFMGFAKAFHLAKIEQLTKDISKHFGILWLITGLLFLFTAVLYLTKRDAWAVLALIAVVVSQMLIIIFWKDARFGTIANVSILIVGVLSWASSDFEDSFQQDVSESFGETPVIDELVTNEDLALLPEPVQKYLSYVGVVGKPKVQNFKITFEGRMRDKEKDWFMFISEQYNFIEDPTRLFFMEAKVKGLTTVGYHSYKDGKASMLIKLVSLFPVVKIDSPEMFPTETVTFFNDLCLFAPAALIDERIRWEAIDERSSRAMFTTKGTTISAILYFNELGQLTNFVSKDRYDISEMRTLPFSTPVKSHGEINGHRLPIEAEAVWHYPDGEFTYGEFRLKTIEYNLNELK